MNDAVARALNKSQRECGERRTSLEQEGRRLDEQIARIKLTVSEAERSELRARYAADGAATDYDKFRVYYDGLAEHERLPANRRTLEQMAEDRANNIRLHTQAEASVQRERKNLNDAVADQTALQEELRSLDQEYSSIANQITKLPV